MNSPTPSSRRFKPFLPEDSTILPVRNIKTITRTVTVNVSEIEKKVEVYRWRAETQFPIAKIKTIKLLPSDSQGNFTQQVRRLQVTFQELVFTIADIEELPLFRVLYLLKQTLIGLQRLYSKFGPFFFTERMVFIDQAGKCKVWMNERVEINELEVNSLSESEFIAHVFWIYKKKTSESKQSVSFYEGIKICKSFFSTLEYLESFVERQKIKVLTYFKIQASSNGTTSLEKKKKKTDLNMTMSKKPNFLVNMQFPSSKEGSLTSSKKDIFDSTKFIPKKVHFSKTEMKVSGDTAADSEKNIKSSNDCGGFSPIMYSRKAFQDRKLFDSDKSERILTKIDAGRKFSHSNQQIPIIQIHEPEFQGQKSQKDVLNEISESMTFFDANEKNSHSSSLQKKEKLIQKKKEVFNFNGWQLKVNSLFSNDSDFTKSFCDKNDKMAVKRQPIKLDLLDKCATNMCESFLGGQQ